MQANYKQQEWFTQIMMISRMRAVRALEAVVASTC